MVYFCLGVLLVVVAVLALVIAHQGKRIDLCTVKANACTEFIKAVAPELVQLAENQAMLATHFPTLVAEQCEMKGKLAELESAIRELEKTTAVMTRVN